MSPAQLIFMYLYTLVLLLVGVLLLVMWFKQGHLNSDKNQMLTATDTTINIPHLLNMGNKFMWSLIWFFFLLSLIT